MADWIEEVKAAAGKNPVYNDILQYLMLRQSVPKVSEGVIGEDTYGTFTPGPEGGQVKLSWRMQDPPSRNRALATLLHETTHAADQSMSNQALNAYIDSGRGKLPSEDRQYLDAYNKLRYGFEVRRDTKGKLPRMDLVNALAEAWAAKEKDYRATEREMTAFGVENMAGPHSVPGWRAPDHVDATAATETMILLDLATKAMKKKQLQP